MSTQKKLKLLPTHWTIWRSLIEDKKADELPNSEVFNIIKLTGGSAALASSGSSLAIGSLGPNARPTEFNKLPQVIHMHVKARMQKR